MNFIKRLFFREEEAIVLSKKQQLNDAVLPKFYELEKAGVSKKNIRYLFFVFRVFMEKMFNIKKQLTIEEMIKELESKRIRKSVRQKIILLSSSINEAKYSNVGIGRVRFNRLISDFKEAINLI